MTKLFSMKSLAFAGAAAFALTLVAAPKANAEEEAKEEAKIEKTNVSISYETGQLTVTGITEENATHVADGYGVYFGSGKDASKIKYSMAPDSTATGVEKITYDISNLLGKEIMVGVALDANGKGAYTDKLVASPKLTAKDIPDKLLSEGEVEAGKKYQYKVGTYGEWKNVGENKEEESPTKETVSSGENKKINLVEDVKRAKLLGTTIYFRMATVDKDVMTSPWSKEVKVKIKAKAKAPKVAIKTAKLTKAFQWNMNSKLEYRVVINKKSSAWQVGSGKTEWSKLIENAINAKVDENKDTDLKDSGNGLKDTKVAELVNGEAIADDVIFQVRTAATTKKDASQITVVSLAKSPDSPTNKEIEVKVVNGKSVSAAAITPKTMPSELSNYMAQYSLDGKAWKNLTKETKIQVDKLSSGNLHLRLVGDGKDKSKNSLLSSAITTVTVPSDGSKKDAKITSKGFKSENGVWKPDNSSDYTTGDSSESGEESN